MYQYTRCGVLDRNKANCWGFSNSYLFNYEIYQECSNVNSVIKIGDWKGQMTELYKLLGIKPDQKWEFESSKLEPCETSVHSRIGENMADLSEIPTTVRDSDSVDVVAPDVQRVDLLDEIF